MWANLIRTVSTKDDKGLRESLKSRVPQERFVAALLVGEKAMSGWHGDLIPMLDDPIIEVRQAARRSLIILSFLEINGREVLTAKKLKTKPPVDFGPSLGAAGDGRRRAVQKWNTWWKTRTMPRTLSAQR